MNEPTDLTGMVERGISAASIQRTLVVIATITAVMFVCLVAGGIWVYLTSVNNRDALCAYRTDLSSRIDTGEQFLLDNPNGIPGIPAKTLQANLVNQKRALKAFSVVDCPND